MTVDLLAENYGIGLERSKQVLRVTTQQGVRSAILPISRRYCADRYFGIKHLNGKFTTDTLWSKVKSLRGNVCSQVYSHKCGFRACYHMPKADGEHVGHTLNRMIEDYGAPEHLIMDGASVQVGSRTSLQNIIRKASIKTHISHPRRPEENPAERAILGIKTRWYRLKQCKNIPDRLWDFGLDYITETGNLTHNSSKWAGGRTPLEVIAGYTPDISEYADFGLWDWVTYKPNAGLGEPELAKWLGVSHRVGQLMTYWVLPISGVPISNGSVQRLTRLEEQEESWAARIKAYNDKINDKMENVVAADLALNVKDVHKDNLISLEDEDEDFFSEFNRVIDDSEVKDVEDIKPEDFGEVDQYLDMELGFRRGDDAEIHFAKVKRRAVDEDGKPVGIPNNNPLLDQRLYEVEFLDGHIENLTANIIAENLLAQVDDEGHRQVLLEDIEDHRVLDSAIPKSQGTYITKNGLKRKKWTTRGWELYVRWKDGSGDWTSLKDLKESYPVELADYAVANGLVDEPAFAWWVPFTLRKRKAIIQKVKTKYWDRTHKYGLQVPKTIEEAKRIDEKAGNDLWQTAIREEMTNYRVAFERFDGDVQSLVGYEEITAHLVFDIKLSENFRRKARYVADGHRTGVPAAITYSTVVSRDSVRIILLIAALNDLEINGADVQNAFLSAPNLEKNWMTAGSEFGAEQGITFIVVRALYGLKSAAAAFRKFMAERLDDLGFTSSLADPDVWMRAAVKPNGDEYYEYLLMYVDDLLAVSINPRAVLEGIQGGTIKFKKGLIQQPESYLGAKLHRRNVDGVECWSIGSVDYIDAAIKTVEEALKNKRHLSLLKTARTPMSLSYCPELDMTEELSSEDITFYQELIGMLRWATELGRVDILHEVAILSQYQAAPRIGHMEQLLRIFAFLKKSPKLSIYMDPTLPNIDYGRFKGKSSDFKEYYRDAEEQMPHRMPNPRGHDVLTTAFVDASFASNKVTRHSHSGYIIFVNSAPIKWFSKKQKTLETSAFSAEYIALRACVEDVESIRFKLRMFGIPIYKGHATNIFCDNQAVVKNNISVDSTLSKKHSSCAYHFTRWCVAAGVISLGWIESKLNLADAFTKRLPADVRKKLFGDWTY